MPNHARRLLLTLLPLFVLLPLAASAEHHEGQDRLADHVVLVSIDGLRPEFYLDPEWPAPMLQQLMEEGAHAEQVEGVFPTVTYPSHTTMVTGVRPDRHGIFYNSPFEPEGQTGRWYWEASAITARTLWDAARDAGVISASLSWPVTVGAPVDFLVPEVWSLTGEDFIAVARANSHPPGLIDEFEREATGRLTVNNFTIDHMTREDRAGAAAAYLLETHKPNLLAVHLIATDHFQHEDGRESWRVRRSVAAVDRALGQIYEAAERAGILDRTTFVVTGDHGHIDLHTRLAPNRLLREAGLMGDSTRERGEWRATFHTTGAAAFLHLRDPADEAALAEVRRLLNTLPPGQRELFEVLDHDDLAHLGAAPEAVLGLALKPGIHVTSDPNAPGTGPAQGATHGYLPDISPHIYTGLVVSGSGIRRGAVAPHLRLTDVAPLIAHLLSLDMPSIDGVLPAGFLIPTDEP